MLSALRKVLISASLKLVKQEEEFLLSLYFKIQQRRITFIAVAVTKTTHYTNNLEKNLYVIHLQDAELKREQVN